MPSLSHAGSVGGAGVGTIAEAAIRPAYVTARMTAARRWPSRRAVTGARPAQIATTLPAANPPRIHMRTNGRVMYGTNWPMANHR